MTNKKDAIDDDPTLEGVLYVPAGDSSQARDIAGLLQTVRVQKETIDRLNAMNDRLADEVERLRAGHADPEAVSAVDAIGEFRKVVTNAAIACKDDVTLSYLGSLMLLNEINHLLASASSPDSSRADVVEALRVEIDKWENDPRTLYPDAEVLQSFERALAGGKSV